MDILHQRVNIFKSFCLRGWMAPLLLFYFEALIIGLAYPMGFEPGTTAEAVRCATRRAAHIST